MNTGEVKNREGEPEVKLNCKKNKNLLGQETVTFYTFMYISAPTVGLSVDICSQPRISYNMEQESN